MNVAPSVAMPVTGAGLRARLAASAEIIGQAGMHIAKFAAQVALQLDDGRAPHRVDAAAAVQQIDLLADLGYGASKPDRRSSVIWPRSASWRGRPAIARTSSGSLSLRQFPLTFR